MATYVNNLRLTELATGEGSGTWGTTTNTSLELIGEALGYNTQDCFSSDADATTTVADGATDPARAFYFKVTSSATLTATRTLTIAPNTVSRVMFIENATTGSQSIAISQGSGANVTIATGKTAVVYLDGAGSGAAVVDAMAGVDPGVTDTLAEVLTAGNTTGGTNIVFGDSASASDDRLLFGAGSDLQIYHNGTKSVIDNATGNLEIRNNTDDGDVLIQSDNGSGGLTTYFLADGSTTQARIFFGGSEKLKTTSTGVDVTGNVVSDGADIDGAAVFNESGADVDFRIESSGKANMFFLDAGNDRVGIGTGVPDTLLHVTTTTSGAVLTLESTSSNNSAGPNILSYRSSSTPAADDNLGKIIYRGTNSAAEDVDYVSVESVLTSPTDGAEQGQYQIETMVDGTSRNRLRINNSETVFNDGGRDLDFRVESDTQSHMLFVDAGNNHVNMGASADYGGRLNVVTGDNTTTLALVSTDADASVGPKLVLRRDSASPADNDNAGQIVFTADNDAGEATTYGFIRATLEDVTDGTEDGILDIQTITAGTTRSRIKVAGAETVINESSQDVDFRVETDGQTHMLFIDGGTDRLMIGKTTADTGVAGTQFRPDGMIAVTRDGDVSAIFNRKTSNGNVVTIRKDNNDVGQIGVNNGANLYIGSDGDG